MGEGVLQCKELSHFHFMGIIMMDDDNCLKGEGNNYIIDYYCLLFERGGGECYNKQGNFYSILL